MEAARLFSALEATWPAAAVSACGPWRIREGRGGGKRVSAAQLDGVVAEGLNRLDAASAAMRALGQAPLVMVPDGAEALDDGLAARGWQVVDPTVSYHAPLSLFPQSRPPRMTGFWSERPLAIAAEIWADSGIGPARLAVMARAAGPKIYLLGRLDERPAWAGFAAIHDGIAMLHALEVRPDLRRRGGGRLALHHVAHWARGEGAQHMALLVTRANAPARALYAGLGMQEGPGYHYRQGGTA